MSVNVGKRAVNSADCSFRKGLLLLDVKLLLFEEEQLTS